MASGSKMKNWSQSFIPPRSPMNMIIMLIEGSLEAKLLTIWRDGNGTARKKLGHGESQKREEVGVQVREKVGKSRNTVFFQCFVAPEGRKVGSLKRRVRR